MAEKEQRCLCKVCGKTFMSPRKKTICSEECVKEQAKRKYLEKYELKGDVNHVCVVCGKAFIDRNPLHTTCSKPCKATLHQKSARRSKMKKTLRDRGIEFTEDNLEEIYKKNVNSAAVQAKKEKKETEAYMKEIDDHIAFRKSIKKETIARDEKKARQLGVSYGYYVAVIKGNEKRNTKG